MDTQMRGYPSCYIKSTQNSQLFRIPSHLGIHLVTPKALKFSTFQDILSLGYPCRSSKALKIVKFSGYPLTWKSMFLHQKHSKFSTFQVTLSLGYPSRYTKSTKILNFSGYPLTWISVPLHQKHSKFSIFQAFLSPGYPFRYSKGTQNSQLFRISSHWSIHVVSPKALKILNFSGYPLTWVSMSFHQKHSKSSTFQDTLYPCSYTKSTQNSQFFKSPYHLGIHLVTPKALKILNFSGYPLT